LNSEKMTMEINRNNYEEFFLLYTDNELSAGDRKAVEEFVRLHPDLKEELDILIGTILIPQAIEFENKEELYKEEERKVVPIKWWRIAAAAVLLFGCGTFGWLYLNNEPAKKPAPVAEVKKRIEKEEKDIIKNEPKITEPAITKTEEKITGPVIGKKAETVETKTEPRKTDRAPVPQIVTPDIEIADVEEPSAAPIDVAVTPRELDEEINDVAVNTLTAANETASQPQSQPEYVQTSDDNIYFVNTSVSKRNKFRGVFRKATRILDKVTSLQ
jgi:hypothetical protein